jgi:hypothetical protein
VHKRHGGVEDLFVQRLNPPRGADQLRCDLLDGLEFRPKDSLALWR